MRFHTLLLLTLAGVSCGCSVTKPTVLRPNQVLIESNNTATIPIAAKLVKKRGYVPVTDRALAQNVLTITVETGFRPYASSRFTDYAFAHSIPVSLNMTNRQGVVTWTSQSKGESDNESEALRIAVRDAIDGYAKRNAGILEIFKTPMDSLLRLKRPTELPPYSPEKAKAIAAWVFEVEEDNQAIPRGKVFLEVNGGRSLILKNAVGNYAETEREEFARHKVPAGALAACAGSWAGSKERFYAIQKGAEVEIYQRTESSEDPIDGGIGKYKLVNTIPVK